MVLLFSKEKELTIVPYFNEKLTIDFKEYIFFSTGMVVMSFKSFLKDTDM